MESVGSKIVVWVAEYVPRAAVPVAIVCNLLTFIVFSMKCYRGSLASMLHCVLALAQTLDVVINEGLHGLPISVGNISLFTYNIFISANVVTAIYSLSHCHSCS